MGEGRVMKYQFIGVSCRRRGLYIFSILIAQCLFFSPFTTADEKNPMELIRSISSAYENVNDYTAIMVKQETRKGILRREENILFKFRKPFQVYMKWLEGPGEGREILYDPEKNDGKMIINPHGLIALIIPIIYIEPDNPMVKSKSLHTIDEAGLGIAIKNLIEQCEAAKKRGELNIKFTGEENFADRICSRIEVFFPEDKSYYAGHIVTYVDREHNLPIHFTIYDWKDRFIEKVSYNDLKINAGLCEGDFDPKNPDYKFKVKDLN